MRTAASLFLTIGLAFSSQAAPLAWLRTGEPNGQQYEGVPYHWLGDAPLRLNIDVQPAKRHALDLLWGSKKDQRGATITINGHAQTITAGGDNGFRWQRVKLPVVDGDRYQLLLQAAPPKAAFIAAVRLVEAGSPLNASLPRSDAGLITRTAPPKSPLEQWMDALKAENITPAERATIHGQQANEALRRCRRYIDGWLAHADPKTGLIPRNLRESKHFWNGRDAGADNYAFMVLTSALTDRAMFDGRMTDMLRTETKLTSRLGALPADFDFTTQKFRHEPPDLDRLIFDGSEYVKDGLMPLTEWLGATPWSDRMISIIDSILAQAPQETPSGPIPSANVEVNGEMMQVLSRLCFMTGNKAYLDMACRIADYHLLGDQHPTRHTTKLGLRDHNCELISGLTEVYAACHFVRKDKVAAYRRPIHAMLDAILKSGVNEHGLMYQTINPQTGEVLNKTIHDNWGYNYNGFYTVYLLDGTERYRDATRRALAALKPHYWKFPWQGWGSDGIADSVEGAINLYNRELDVAGVPAWIDANIARMLDIQKPDGVIEGWHGDGNYARTAIMWVLWKQQGVTIQPWREDVKLGAVRNGDSLHLAVSCDQPWSGKLVFDTPRHRTIMKLPLDYPRINQFPEWFTVEPQDGFRMNDRKTTGKQLLEGLPIELKAGESRSLVLTPAA